MLNHSHFSLPRPLGGFLALAASCWLTLPVTALATRQDETVKPYAISPLPDKLSPLGKVLHEILKSSLSPDFAPEKSIHYSPYTSEARRKEIAKLWKESCKSWDQNTTKSIQILPETIHGNLAFAIINIEPISAIFPVTSRVFLFYKKDNVWRVAPAISNYHNADLPYDLELRKQLETFSGEAQKVHADHTAQLRNEHTQKLRQKAEAIRRQISPKLPEDEQDILFTRILNQALGEDDILTIASLVVPKDSPAADGSISSALVTPFLSTLAEEGLPKNRCSTFLEWILKRTDGNAPLIIYTDQDNDKFCIIPGEYQQFTKIPVKPLYQNENSQTALLWEISSSAWDAGSRGDSGPMWESYTEDDSCYEALKFLQSKYVPSLQSLDSSAKFITSALTKANSLDLLSAINLNQEETIKREIVETIKLAKFLKKQLIDHPNISVVRHDLPESQGCILFVKSGAPGTGKSLTLTPLFLGQTPSPSSSSIWTFSCTPPAKLTADKLADIKNEVTARTQSADLALAKQFPSRITPLALPDTEQASAILAKIAKWNWQELAPCLVTATLSPENISKCYHELYYLRLQFKAIANFSDVKVLGDQSLAHILVNLNLPNAAKPQQLLLTLLPVDGEWRIISEAICYSDSSRSRLNELSISHVEKHYSPEIAEKIRSTLRGLSK